jgi:ribosomal protein S18 acetylase RimI-like enzyme
VRQKDTLFLSIRNQGDGMLDNPAYRPANVDDCYFIAEMIEVSSDGVALIEWAEEAQKVDGRTVLDVGAEMYASEDGDYSYRNCWIAEVSRRRAGMLLAFPMPAREATDIMPPPFDGTDVFAPYKYLEAPDTWYICGVAVLREYRGHGIGTGLMKIAREQALAHGYSQLSLVVFEENIAAVRLYKRLGYEIVDAAPVVAHPLIRYTGNALLMVASAS